VRGENKQENAFQATASGTGDTMERHAKRLQAEQEVQWRERKKDMCQ